MRIGGLANEVRNVVWHFKRTALIQPKLVITHKLLKIFHCFIYLLRSIRSVGSSSMNEGDFDTF